MKKLLKIIPALVFAACCFMFAAKCLNAGGFTGAIADFPTAIHRAVKGQMQATTDYLNGEQTEYDADSPVSMNMWGLTPEFFAILKNGFEQFLNKTDMEDLKAEYLLPTIIGELLKEGTVSVKVLKSEDQWFGVTYKEDRETVVEAVKSLIDKGIYPDKL